jgi:hypothetical protein
MRITKDIVLELGNCPLDEKVVKEIVRYYLIAHTPDWVLRKTHQWEVVISGCLESADFADFEKGIIKEIERLSQLHWDLEALGL